MRGAGRGKIDVQAQAGVCVRYPGQSSPADLAREPAFPESDMAFAGGIRMSSMINAEHKYEAAPA
jgi:hypothetical protein